jgi:hypothetical protein
MPRAVRPASRAAGDLIGLPVATFNDALAFLLGLQDRFRRRFHAALLLDEERRLVDGCVLTAKHHRAQDALALVLLGPEVRGGQALVFSCGHGPVGSPTGDDLDRWRELVEQAAGAGVVLLDWLAADQEQIRSFAITERGATAWGTPA